MYTRYYIFTPTFIGISKRSNSIKLLLNNLISAICFACFAIFFIAANLLHIYIGYVWPCCGTLIQTRSRRVWLYSLFLFLSISHRTEWITKSSKHLALAYLWLQSANTKYSPLNDWRLADNFGGLILFFFSRFAKSISQNRVWSESEPMKPITWHFANHIPMMSKIYYYSPISMHSFWANSCARNIFCGYYVHLYL